MQKLSSNSANEGAYAVEVWLYSTKTMRCIIWLFAPQHVWDTVTKLS